MNYSGIFPSEFDSIQRRKNTMRKKMNIKLQEPKRKFTLTPKIMRNFGKAICEFMLSKKAIPSLDQLIKKENLDYKEFYDFLIQSVEFFEQNGNFIALIIPQMTDDNKIKACKRVIKELSRIFVKYYSLNWILKSQDLKKECYLKCRIKVLNAINLC